MPRRLIHRIDALARAHEVLLRLELRGLLLHVEVQRGSLVRDELRDRVGVTERVVPALRRRTEPPRERVGVVPGSLIGRDDHVAVELVAGVECGHEYRVEALRLEHERLIEGERPEPIDLTLHERRRIELHGHDRHVRLLEPAEAQDRCPRTARPRLQTDLLSDRVLRRPDRILREADQAGRRLLVHRPDRDDGDAAGARLEESVGSSDDSDLRRATGDDRHGLHVRAEGQKTLGEGEVLQIPLVFRGKDSGELDVLDADLHGQRCRSEGRLRAGRRGRDGRGLRRGTGARLEERRDRCHASSGRADTQKVPSCERRIHRWVRRLPRRHRNANASVVQTRLPTSFSHPIRVARTRSWGVPLILPSSQTTSATAMPSRRSRSFT